MSHSLAAGGNSWGEQRWVARLGQRVGHHAGAVLVASILGAIALGLFPLAGLVGLLVPVALFALVLLSWGLMRQHDRRLCEPCMAAMPLNPAELAARYRRRFWLAHTGLQARFLLPYLVLLIGSNLFTGPIGRSVWVLMQLSMIYLIMAQTAHRRLQPWCPWCSDGGGGEKQPETPPVLPNDDRQLV